MSRDTARGSELARGCDEVRAEQAIPKHSSPPPQGDTHTEARRALTKRRCVGEWYRFTAHQSFAGPSRSRKEKLRIRAIHPVYASSSASPSELRRSLDE